MSDVIWLTLLHPMVNVSGLGPVCARPRELARTRNIPVLLPQLDSAIDRRDY